MLRVRPERDNEFLRTAADEAERQLPHGRSLAYLALGGFGAVRELSGEGVDISIGVGLHRGQVVAGNVGSSQHLEYTLIGDVVNVAARLEALTCEYPGVDVIVSQEVVSAATDNPALTPLGPALLKGRRAPIDVFALPVEELTADWRSRRRWLLQKSAPPPPGS